MKSKVFLETFGCQMNVADSERAAARLQEAGYELTAAVDDADAVIFNTCSIRAKAEQKVFNRIGEVRKQKQRAARAQPVIGVMGCVAQLEGEAIFAQSPTVNLVIGTRATDRLPQMLAEALARPERQLLDTAEREAGERWNLGTANRHSPYTAFVPIIEGCNKFCSYCIVPYSRGREKSRPATQIIAEVESLRDAGYSEVHLIGQNVNSYRPRDRDPSLEKFAGATAFSKLLRAVAATGIARIKFTTSFPRDFHPEIVAAIDENQNLCNWVHLPAQSGSDRVLRAMRRGHKIADYMERVKIIKNARRRISLTSDIIVGFPGETSAEFAETMSLVRACQYDGLYIFKYSMRKGTPACLLPDMLTDGEKASRFEALEEVQMSSQREVYRSYLGTEVEVLAEKLSARSANDLTGHTTCHKVVNFRGDKSLLGRVLRIRITETKSHSLRGALIN